MTGMRLQTISMELSPVTGRGMHMRDCSSPVHENEDYPVLVLIVHLQALSSNPNQHIITAAARHGQRRYTYT